MGERSARALSWGPGVITLLLLGSYGYWREYLQFKWAMLRLRYEVRLFLNSTSVLLRLVEGSQALAMGLQLSVPMPPVQRLEASKRHPRKCTQGVLAARKCIRRELVNVLRLVEYSLYAMRARGFSTGFSSSCPLFRSHKWLNVEGGQSGGSDDLLLERLKCLRDDVKDCLGSVFALLLKNHQSMGLDRESRAIALELTTACEYSRQHIEEVTAAWSVPCSPSLGPVVKELDTARLQCETMLIHLYEAQMELRQDTMSQDAASQVASRAAYAIRDSCQNLTEMIEKWGFIHVPVTLEVVREEGGAPLPISNLSMSKVIRAMAKESCTEVAWDSNSVAIDIKDGNVASGYNLEIAPPQDQVGDGHETKSESSFPEIYESSSSYANPEEEMLITPLPKQISLTANNSVGSLASVMEELHDVLSCCDPLQPCKVTTIGGHPDESISQDGMMTCVKGKQPRTSFLNELQAAITAKK